MKPQIAIAWLLALPALAGCMYSGTVWVRSGGSDAERTRDMAQCEYETMAATQQANYGYRTGLVRELDRRARREELAAYCMKARGYFAAGPTGAPVPAAGYVEKRDDGVTVKVEAKRPAPKLGKFTFEAEKFAKTERCSSAPAVTLTATGPGFENYSITCADGDALVVRCDLGNCRILK